MGIHFMAVLGTSPYTDCVYEAADKSFAYQTPFVQLAALKYKMPEYTEGTRITIFVTEKAEKSNWLNRDYTERELASFETAPNGKRTGLKELLETAYPHAPIKSIRVPEGRNKAELDEIFEIIYGAIEPEETIVFDFTHGLRNIPMQALTIIHYAKALKKIQVGGIFYGAFELGVKGADGLVHVELQDMSSCSTVLDWTSAAEAFVKGGSSNQIQELYKERDGKKTLLALHHLTNCLETSRGKASFPGKVKRRTAVKQSIREAYCYFQESYSEMLKSGQTPIEAPLRRLLEQIREDVEIFERELFLDKEGGRIALTDTATGMAAVQWAIHKGLIQQGFTALEETIKTYVCERYQIFAGEEETRDGIVGSTLKYVAKRLQNESGAKKPSKEELCSGRLEELERDARYQALEEKKKADYKNVVIQMIEEQPESLFRLSAEVSDWRNNLNHFGFQRAPLGYDLFQEKLKKKHAELKEIMRADAVEGLPDEKEEEPQGVRKGGVV